MMKLPMETIAHRWGIQSRYNRSVLSALIIRYLAFVITQEHHQSIFSVLFCLPIPRSTLMNLFNMAYQKPKKEIRSAPLLSRGRAIKFTQTHD